MYRLHVSVCWQLLRAESVFDLCICYAVQIKTALSWICLFAIADALNSKCLTLRHKQSMFDIVRSNNL